MRGQVSAAERELAPMGKLRIAAYANANVSWLQIEKSTTTATNLFSGAQVGATHTNPQIGFGGGFGVAVHYPLANAVAVELGAGLSRFRSTTEFTSSRPLINDFNRLCPPILSEGKVSWDFYAVDIPIMLQFRSPKVGYFELGIRGLSITQGSMQRSVANFKDIQSCEVVIDTNFRPQRNIISPIRVSELIEDWSVSANQFRLSIGGGFAVRKQLFCTFHVLLPRTALSQVASSSTIKQSTFELGFRYEFFK